MRHTYDNRYRMASESVSLLFDKVEAAIDAHPVWKRAPGAEPEFQVTRHGIGGSVKVKSKLVPQRSSVTLTTKDYADTMAEAAEMLIEELDKAARVELEDAELKQRRKR